jgi:hypothetical protein
VNISTTLLPTTVPVLLDILRDIPYIDFDMNLTWDGELLALVSPNDYPNEIFCQIGLYQTS